MVPNYRKVTGLLRDYGVDAIFVDSDGNIDKLIPLWLEGGVNGFHPLEVAAGSDPVALRKQYGRKVLLRGGIDKRKIALGGRALRNEVMSKVPFLARSGGYIPYIDHDVPPDISWADFQEYTRLLKEAAVCSP
jgi:uroporphyrinogen decarboxylase